MKLVLAILLLIAAVVPAQALDPGQYDITVYANEDFRLNLTHTSSGQPINLTGYSFKLQAKKTPTAPVFCTMSSSIVNAAAGTTTHTLSRRYTAAIANTAGVYDLLQTAPDGTTSYRMQGKIRVLETITR